MGAAQRGRLGIAACLLLTARVAGPADPGTTTIAAAGSQMSGDVLYYVVSPGDTWTAIASRYGVSRRVLARANGRRVDVPPVAGEVLDIDRRHIVPGGLTDGILINIPQRMLFFLEGGALVSAHPVGLGRPDWRTPRGDFTIVTKEEDPIWDVPVSIQEEMRQSGQEVITRMPHGDLNPLGEYWLGTTLPAIGIHGTIAPSSVYRFSTHGCIRLHADDAAALYERVALGVEGRILYEPVLVLPLPDGRVFLEANPDAYKKAGSLSARVRTLLRDNQLEGRVDPKAAADVVQRAEGVARDVTAASR